MPQTLTSTYTPTLMEKLLGRNYKWWYVITYAAKLQTTYLWDNFMWAVANSIIIFGGVYIWAIQNEINQKEILTYLIIGNLFNTLSSNYVGYTIYQHIKSGKLSNRMLVPQNIILNYLFFSIGNTAVTLISYSVIFIIIIFFYSSQILWGNFLLFPIFLIMAFLIKFLSNFILGCIAFWATEASNTIFAFDGLSNFLSGNLVPLNILPTFLSFLPFAWLLHHPMQIYLGKYNFQETLLTFAGGIIWCTVLYFLAKLVFKAGLKKNEAVGL